MRKHLKHTRTPYNKQAIACSSSSFFHQRSYKSRYPVSDLNFIFTHHFNQSSLNYFHPHPRAILNVGRRSPTRCISKFSPSWLPAVSLALTPHHRPTIVKRWTIKPSWPTGTQPLGIPSRDPMGSTPTRLTDVSTRTRIIPALQTNTANFSCPLAVPARPCWEDKSPAIPIPVPRCSPRGRRRRRNAANFAKSAQVAHQTAVAVRSRAAANSRIRPARTGIAAHSGPARRSDDHGEFSGGFKCYSEEKLTF